MQHLLSILGIFTILAASAPSYGSDKPDPSACFKSTGADYVETYKGIAQAALSTEVDTKEQMIRELWADFFPERGKKRELYRESFTKPTVMVLGGSYNIQVEEFSLSEYLKFVDVRLALDVDAKGIMERVVRIPIRLILDESETQRSTHFPGHPNLKFLHTDHQLLHNGNDKPRLPGQREISLGYFVSTINGFPQLEFNLASTAIFRGVVRETNDSVGGYNFAYEEPRTSSPHSLQWGFRMSLNDFLARLETIQAL